MNKSKMQILYNKNKNQVVGDLCFCPSCGLEFIKETYQQVFCSSSVNKSRKCKDLYWNTIDENKRNNKTRISPASARWQINNL